MREGGMKAAYYFVALMAALNMLVLLFSDEAGLLNVAAFLVCSFVVVAGAALDDYQEDGDE
jgi:hypothetical protein